MREKKIIKKPLAKKRSLSEKNLCLPKKSLGLNWSKDFNCWWLIFLSGLLLVLIFIFSFRKIDAMDVAYQMKFAELVWQGNLPQTDPFTFSVPHNSYLCLNFFFDTICLILYRLGSFEALSLFLPVTVMGLFLLLYDGAKKYFPSAKPRALLWVGLGTILALQYRFGVCSEQLALIYLVATILVNEKFCQNKQHQYRHLGWLFLIQLLWVNTQATFVLGWIITGSYFLADWWQTKKFDRQFFLIGGGIVLLSLANPYTWRGAIFPFQSLAWFGGSDYFNQTISEYYSLPQFFVENTLGFQNGSFYSMIAFFIFIIVVLATYVCHYKKLKIYHWLPLLCLGFLTWTGNRTLPFLVLTVCLPTAEFLSQKTDFRKLNFWWQKICGRTSQRVRKGLLILSDFIFIGIIIVFSYGVISSEFYGLECARFGWGAQENYLPYKGARFIKESGLQGRILNEYTYGGWLVLEQDNPIYINGHLEVMGEKLYRESEYIQTSGRVEKLLNKYQPSLIFYRVSRDEPYISIYQNVLNYGGYKIAYVDEVVIIFASEQALSKAGRSEYDWQNIIQSWQLQTTWTDAEIKTVLEKKYQNQEIKSLAQFLNTNGVVSKWGVIANIWQDYPTSEILLLNFLKETNDFDYGAYLVLLDTFLAQAEYEKASWTLAVISQTAIGKAKTETKHLALEIAEYQELEKNKNDIQALLALIEKRIARGDANSFATLLDNAWQLDPDNERLKEIIKQYGN